MLEDPGEETYNLIHDSSIKSCTRLYFQIHTLTATTYSSKMDTSLLQFHALLILGPNSIFLKLYLIGTSFTSKSLTWRLTRKFIYYIGALVSIGILYQSLLYRKTQEGNWNRCGKFNPLYFLLMFSFLFSL